MIGRPEEAERPSVVAEAPGGPFASPLPQRRADAVRQPVAPRTVSPAGQEESNYSVCSISPSPLKSLSSVLSTASGLDLSFGQSAASGGAGAAATSSGIGPGVERGCVVRFENVPNQDGEDNNDCGGISTRNNDGFSGDTTIDSEELEEAKEDYIEVKLLESRILEQIELLVEDGKMQLSISDIEFALKDLALLALIGKASLLMGYPEIKDQCRLEANRRHTEEAKRRHTEEAAAVAAGIGVGRAGKLFSSAAAVPDQCDDDVAGNGNDSSIASSDASSPFLTGRLNFDGMKTPFPGSNREDLGSAMASTLTSSLSSPSHSARYDPKHEEEMMALKEEMKMLKDENSRLRGKLDEGEGTGKDTMDDEAAGGGTASGRSCSKRSRRIGARRHGESVIESDGDDTDCSIGSNDKYGDDSDYCEDDARVEKVKKEAEAAAKKREDELKRRILQLEEQLVVAKEEGVEDDVHNADAAGDGRRGGNSDAVDQPGVKMDHLETLGHGGGIATNFSPSDQPGDEGELQVGNEETEAAAAPGASGNSNATTLDEDVELAAEPPIHVVGGDLCGESALSLPGEAAANVPKDVIDFVTQLGLVAKVRAAVLDLHQHQRNKEATGELDLSAYVPTPPIIEQRDSFLRRIQSRQSRGDDNPPFYVFYGASFLVAVIERLRTSILLRHDLASSSPILRDLLSLFLNRSEYTLKRLTVEMHKEKVTAKKVKKLQKEVSDLPIKAGVSKNHVFENCGLKEKGDDVNVDDVVDEGGEDAAAAKEHIMAMQRAGAIVIGKKARKGAEHAEASATEMDHLLKLRDAGFFCKILASIDIGCGALARICFDSLPSSSRKGVEGLAKELGVNAEGTVADIYRNVIGPGLKRNAKKAGRAFVDIMIEIRKLPGPFSAEASTNALGDSALDSAAVTIDAKQTNYHATILLAFLLSASYEDALWRHLRVRIDFASLILRNSFSNIHHHCRFVWRDTRKGYLLDDEIEPEDIMDICRNIKILIDGASKTRLSTTTTAVSGKVEEYRMKRVLLEGVKGNVDLVSRNLMIADESDECSKI
eukprot:CAMPEP_0178479990 /NCGR_PEP_ID=MMETSP0696-20121128/5465_1 /TAXON_ID=265572 /ORGANISM="Extubocellulus spinifer, Strain CCMP396" /LENGTH=1052 /DNA_ID=CAMNT_0020107417 /DNA_START=50 /DNA_END=3208 /DNA_ORIENTATION=+